MKIIFITILSLSLFSCKESKKNGEAITKPKDEFRIAYNVLYDDENDDYEVFSMDLDGSDPKNITNLKGVEWTYYAYGKDLYFISDKDTASRNYFLYKTDVTGASPKKIFNKRLADSWMGSRKNGQELIIRPHKSVDTAFYIIDTLGGIIKTLKPDLAYFNDPEFSPDGKKIVFRGSNKAFKKDSGYLDELYIMNADGSDLKKLTTYPSNDTTSTWYNYHAGPPRWHPTENFISYQSRQRGKSRLFGIDPSGEEARELIKNDSLNQGWHAWSDDGKWLAVEVSELDGSQYHIQLINWKTKKAKILTDTLYKFQQAPIFVKIP
ncbi:TolB family protein [Christiangramia aquimixticola]|uniref:TolB family protein n=1 Tax=Christiangramia aquimixticola TaxID=1697558 RepID=UPI003AA8745A